jgi:signal transduction histidine kinase/PleD family two-component response regulator
MFVIVLQIVWICGLLWMNGTIETLVKNALDILVKNTESSASSMENNMIQKWSNIGSLASDVNSLVSRYIENSSLTADEFLQNEGNIEAISENVSEVMLGALRFSNATGIFVIFSNTEEESVENGETVYLPGLHFRDLDPDKTPADYSDIMMERGDGTLARKHGVSLDNLWQKYFSVSPASVSDFAFYLEPFRAAKEHPELTPEKLGYWGAPRVLATAAGADRRDANPYITYSVPLIYNGTVIGVIGTEIQVSMIEKNYLRESDFSNIGAGGYILGSYNGKDTDSSVLNLNPMIVSGDVAQTRFNKDETVTVFRDTFNPWHDVSDTIYVMNPETKNDHLQVHMSVYKLKLYAADSPFINEVWAVAGTSPNDYLFAMPNTIQRDVIISALICLAVGLILVFITVALTVRPLRSLTAQITDIDFTNEQLIEPPKHFDVHEIAVLRNALNFGRKRVLADAKTLSDERERYKLALSLATGTVVEYIAAVDTLFVSRFNSDNSEASELIFEKVVKRLAGGSLTHPDDIKLFTDFLLGKSDKPVTVRIRREILPIDTSHIDSDYLWIRFVGKAIFDVIGQFERLIGTSQNVTREELQKQQQIMDMRIDPTTRLYNNEYGRKLCNDALRRNLAEGRVSVLAQIQIEPAFAVEAYYGLFYTNVLHIMIVRVMERFLTKDDVFIRAGDNELLVLMTDTDPKITRLRCLEMAAASGKVYLGENEDIKLSISIGAAVSHGEYDIFDLASRANTALRYVLAYEPGDFRFYDDLPPAENTIVSFEPTPIAFDTDITAMSITGIAFNLFERTRDTISVINILLRIIAFRYNLRRVFIAENDMAFLTNTVEFYYSSVTADDFKREINRVPEQYFAEYNMFTHNDSGYIVTSENPPSDSIKSLLRLDNIDEYSIFTCGMFVNGELYGKVVFMHDNPDYQWDKKATEDLNEVTKIITSHLTRAKSDTASKAKTEFLSKISHEIRTPMNAIIGLTEIAERSDAEDNHARVKDCLAKIDNSAKFLLTIINDVLDMSKIESGKVIIDESPFDLLNTVRDIDHMIRPMLDTKGMDFIVETNVTHTRVLGDEPRLKQVIMNLLGNALKFTDAGYIKFEITETVSLNETDNAPPKYTFAVTDTGIGISDEDSARIFGSYVQVSSAHKVYGGTGLGLAISSQIIKMMGGTIELESKLGEGSRFCFTIALVSDTEHEKEPGQSSHAGKVYTDYFKGKHALLVEDNELNTEIAVVILEDAGFEVTTAENGLLGAGTYDERPDGYFDVILMDIRMPVLDGLGATRMIRQNTKHPDARTVPIIAMTANAFDEDMRKSLEAGMSGYLPKPIDTVKLYELLDDILSGKQSL